MPSLAYAYAVRTDRAVKKAAAAGENFIASHRREGSRTVARWVGARPESEFYYHDFVVSRRHMETGRAPRTKVHLLREGAARRSLRFVSDEAPYDDSLTSEQALLPDVMLALEMDGGPLSRPHGGPARVVMPQMYGYKSVKWVTGIDVRTDLIAGYWEQHGYDADAWIGRSTPPGIVPSVLSGSTLVDHS